MSVRADRAMWALRERISIPDSCDVAQRRAYLVERGDIFIGTLEVVDEIISFGGRGLRGLGKGRAGGRGPYRRHICRATAVAGQRAGTFSGVAKLQPTAIAAT